MVPSRKCFPERFTGKCSEEMVGTKFPERIAEKVYLPGKGSRKGFPERVPGKGSRKGFPERLP